LKIYFFLKFSKKVGKNENPLATKLELGKEKKETKKDFETKKESETKKEEKEKKPKKDTKKKEETRKDSENPKKEQQIVKKETESTSGKKEAYDVDKLISLEKELKSKLTRLIIFILM
jgi:hypothetical protein